MAKTIVMFRIDVGYNPELGYAAVVLDGLDKKQKGVKGNSIRQLMRRVSDAVCEEEQRKRRFPLEQDAPVLITPESGDPLFKGV